MSAIYPLYNLEQYHLENVGIVILPIVKGFPGGLAVKNPPAMQQTQVQSLGQEDALEKGMTTHPSPVFLPEKPHGQRSLASYSPWGPKELDMT